MNFSKKLVSGIGILALGFSMTAGMAAADPGPTDSDEAVVNVTCPLTQTVEVNVDGEMTLDATTGGVLGLPDLVDSTTTEVEVVLDLTCNYSRNFQVGAHISPFYYQGTDTLDILQASYISGSHFRMDNGDGNFNGIGVKPEIKTTVFGGIPVNESEAITPGTFIFWDAPAAGITTATWEGGVYLVPNNLGNGKYVADLDVELSVS